MLSINTSRRSRKPPTRKCEVFLDSQRKEDGGLRKMKGRAKSDREWEKEEK